MVSLFKKNYRSTLLALLSLSSLNSSLTAWESCDSDKCNRFYIGAFGGGIYSNSNEMSQMGTAFFTEAEGGPLAVFAEGRANKTSSGFGGVQLGYEWSHSPCFGCSDWNVTPASEIEAYFFSNKKKGDLINPTDRLPEHDFLDSFHMSMSTVLVNAVFSLNNSCFCRFSPYVGGGIGATHISLTHADSLQVDPLEAGINHFNSDRSDTTWAFAAQAKAGLKYKICESFYVFGEYRYLFVDTSNYILGSTVYPTHAPTSPWNVKVKGTNYNAFAVGIQYDL